VRFDCLSKFKRAPFYKAHYVSGAAKTAFFASARALFNCFGFDTSPCSALFAVKWGRRPHAGLR